MEEQCVEVLSIEEYENPVKFWQERSRRAMEAMGMAVSRRPGSVPLPAGVKGEIKGPCDELPIGLICNTCSTRMLQFTRRVQCTVHCYDKEATVPFKLFLYCVNMKCKAEMIVERNKELKDYVVLCGATRYFAPAEEDNSESSVQSPIPRISSIAGSEAGSHAGDPALDKKEKSAGDSAQKSRCEKTRGSSADDLPIHYKGRIYLGGPRGYQRLRKAKKESERRLLVFSRMRLRQCNPRTGNRSQ